MTGGVDRPSTAPMGMSPNRGVNARSRLPVTALAVVLGLAAGLVPRAQAATFYVDAASPNCSPNGPGTEAQPYCTIQDAVNRRAAAGNTILVKPGVYRERVDIRASGSTGSPIVIRAAGPGVVLDEADDISDPTDWEPAGGTLWVTDEVTGRPAQVFANGARLADSTASAQPLPPGAFTWVPGQGLYVNLGGPAPGEVQIEVGARLYGFNMVGRSWITIDGFTIRHAESRGVYLQGGCTNVTVANNQIQLSDESGIQVVGGSSIVLEGNVVSESGPHGIAIISGATNCILRYNESSRSKDPDIRKADGIYLFASPGNTLYGNRTHENQDSGIHFGPGSHDCVSFNNRSWSNGDHGYDHLGAMNTTHSNDIAWGNYKDGWSIEGGATGTRMHNCISVDNGLTTDEFNLWVDTGSTSGFVSDHNLFWNSAPQEPVRYANIKYATVAAYVAVSGQDTHSIEADPRFVNPSTGDFRLRSGSPAIDAGDSGAPAWPATDLIGAARVDVPASANTGGGPVPYADLGCLEHQLAAPVAALVLSPASGTTPLTVTADASGSTDPDDAVATYQFDFGDGTIIGPQASPVASHALLTGNRNVMVTVTDGDGLSGSTSRPVTVLTSLRAALAMTPATGNDPLHVIVDGSGSSDSYATIVSYQFDFGDGATVGPQASPVAGHAYAPGTWQAAVIVRNAIGDTVSAVVDVIVAEVDPGLNMVGNPSWEADTLGWAPENSVVSLIAGGFDGGQALNVRSPSGTGSFGIVDAPHWVTSTSAANTRYRCRAWVRSAAAGGAIRLRVRELDALGKQIGPTVLSYPVRLSSRWQLVGMDYLSRATGSSLAFGIIDMPADAGEVFQVDNVSIRVLTTGTNGGPPFGGGGFVAPVVFPNPMAERGTIRFSLSQAGPLRVQVFDVSGRVIRTFADEAEVLPGQYEYVLDDRDHQGRQVGPGVYFYRMESRERTVRGRFLIVR
ncbi:MAG TPA: PKD domain-containing protein [Candidatus Eisenbacteria bacterium]|nr:PKD domain-containing protein [Candidatus Eisenbacteria bacterium]